MSKQNNSMNLTPVVSMAAPVRVQDFCFVGDQLRFCEPINRCRDVFKKYKDYWSRRAMCPESRRIIQADVRLGTIRSAIQYYNDDPTRMLVILRKVMSENSANIIKAISMPSSNQAEVVDDRRIVKESLLEFLNSLRAFYETNKDAISM